MKREGETDIGVSQSTLLDLPTSPQQIKTIAITKDDRYLIYTENSTLRDPEEMWISGKYYFPPSH